MSDFDPYSVPELPDADLNNFAIANNTSFDTAEYALNGLPACDLEQKGTRGVGENDEIIPYGQLGEGLKHV
jgi:hypothetical protein